MVTWKHLVTASRPILIQLVAASLGTFLVCGEATPRVLGNAGPGIAGIVPALFGTNPETTGFGAGIMGIFGDCGCPYV